MGRFYKSTRPEFVDDIMYRPPWELMQQNLEKKQQNYDNTLGAIELFKGQLDIKHRNTIGDTQTAKDKAAYYESAAEDLSVQLQEDPASAKQVALQMSKLGRELGTDKKYGDISQIEGTYNNYVGKVAEYDALIKEGKMTGAEKMRLLANEDEKRGGNTLTGGVWSGEDYIQQPEILKSKNLLEMLKQIPEYKDAQSVIEKEGEYFVVRDSGTEKIDTNRLLNAAESFVYGDSGTLDYLAQQQRIGMPGANYFEKDIEGNMTGKHISPYSREYYSNSTGKSFTGEQISNMSEKERKTLPKDLNMRVRGNQTPLGSLFNMVNSMNFDNTTSATTKLTRNQTMADNVKRQHDIQLENLKTLNSITRDNNNYTNELDMAVRKGEITPKQHMSETLQADSKQSYTEDELATKASNFINYMQKGVENLTPQQKEEFDASAAFYKTAGEGLGVDAQVVADVHNLIANPGYGITTKPLLDENGDQMYSLPTGVVFGDPEELKETTKSPERIRMEESLAKWKKLGNSIEDFNKKIVKISTDADIAYYPSPDTELGKTFIGTLNTAFRTGNYQIKDGKYKTVDENGKLRKGTEFKSKIDLSIWEFGADEEEAGQDVLNTLANRFNKNPMDFIQGAGIVMNGDFITVTGNVTVPQGGDITQADLEGFNNNKVSFVLDKIENPVLFEQLKNSPALSGPNGQIWLANADNGPKGRAFRYAGKGVDSATKRITKRGESMPFKDTKIKIEAIGDDNRVGNSGLTYSINYLPEEHRNTPFTQNEVKFLLKNVHSSQTEAQQKEIIKANLGEFYTKKRDQLFR